MIAVLSDSHIPGRAEEIPEKFWDKIEEAEIVVHAGDYAREETFNALEVYSEEFYGAKGNCDFFESDNLEESHTFEHEGLEFGVYHGTGISPRGHAPTLQKIAAKDLGVDVLIHGHTHNEDIEEMEKALLLNPGSCTGVGGGSARPSNPTMMIIKVNGSVFEASIIEHTEDEIVEKESTSFDVEEIKNKQR